MKNFYKSNVLLAALSVLILMLIIIDIYVFRNEPLIFWISLPILLGVSGLALGKLLQIRQSEGWYFGQLSNEIRNSVSLSYINFPLPICVINNDRKILWVNNQFGEKFFEPYEDNCSIEDVTDKPPELFGEDGREICYNDIWYRVFSITHTFMPEERIVRSSDVQLDSEALTVMIFRDVTDFKTLYQTYKMTRPVVMLLKIDNYEELLAGERESERAKVTIRVDRLMEEYFSEKHAVMRKLSGDKFLVVLDQQYVDEMISAKFDLISKAHEIIVRENIHVTFSMGIGTCAESLAESEQFASDMLNNALDRGGDQALVKTASGFDSFGTSSSGNSSSGKVKIRIAAEKIQKLIIKADTVYVMGHAFSDFDSAGAAIGLTCAIRKLGQSAYVAAHFRDPLKTNAKTLYDKFADYEKLNYDVPIIVEPDEALQWITDKTLLIIVDTHILKKLDDPRLYEAVQPDHVVIIDHHRLSAGAIPEYAARCYDPNASSASELVTELIQYLSSNPLITGREAEALLAGIMLDTKDFVMRSGVATFEAAAYLKKMGANTIAVKKLFDTTIDSKLLKAKIISSASIYRVRCAIAVVEEPLEGVRVLCSQAADEMLYIRNVDASFTVYPIENGWSISARSLEKINVQIIMENMGNKIDDGGGHLSMAGCQLYGITCEETVDRLHKAIDNYFDSEIKSN